MTEVIPDAVLSEALQDRLNGRKVLAAVFCTFRFDPGFFEQEVLPLLFDLQFHQDPLLRKAQLEEALRSLAGQVAVYYDPHALVESGRGPASLDVRRIPVKPSTGYFHPKNTLLLVQDSVGGQRSLLILTGSANLTQAGWWENVECAHIEEIAEGGKSRMRDGLLDFIDHLRRLSKLHSVGGPLDEIRGLVRRLSPVANRSAQGVLHQHFLTNGRRGASTFADLLGAVLRNDLRGADLEIISPYLDDADDSAALAALVNLIQPRKWRILLPEDRGAARCRETLFDWVEEGGGEWGRLPIRLTSASVQEAKARRVHAKVYRLFTKDREVVILGSFNMTQAAHQAAGNVESGVLVEGPTGARRRRFWLEPVEGRPDFAAAIGEEDDLDAELDFIPLVVRYDWSTGEAQALWDAGGKSPRIEVSDRGLPVFAVAKLVAREWQTLPADQSHALRDRLRHTSLLTVIDGDRRGVILVQEEGMAYRPSLLLDLSPAEILRYWSLLSARQRAAVIAEHGERLAESEGIEQLKDPKMDKAAHDSIFDRHAGIFHGFGSLTRTIVAALEEDGVDQARFRMFGAKYDSLPVLVEGVAGDAASDPLDRYLMLLCAQQLADRIRIDWPDFWAGEPAGVQRLRDGLGALAGLREDLFARNDETMASFLDWYEPLFLREAEMAAT